MECMEKGYLIVRNRWASAQLGDVEGAYRLLQMISHREGFGDVLAEGVSEHRVVCGEADAPSTQEARTPRGHDHRGRWEEMLDTHLVQRDHGERQPDVPDGDRAPACINPFDLSRSPGS